jgi:hypothetical protein
VAAVDANGDSLTLRLAAGEVQVNVNRQTQLQDDTDRVDILRLENIVAGDFLEV